VRIVRLAVDEQADALLCGGDLYEHDRVSPDTAAFLRTLFEGIAPLPVYLAPGNHDWLGPDSLYRRVSWPSNVHVFGSDRLEPVSLGSSVTLWGAAHCAPAATRNFLDGFHVDRAGVHLALFHGSEQGWLAIPGTSGSTEGVPHAPFSEPQIQAAGLHHAFLGHYHCPHDAQRFTYPGNPEPLAFGEDGERGAVVVSVAPDGAIARRRHRVSTLDVHDLRVDITGCASEYDVRTRLMDVLQPLRGLARVTLYGELASEIDLCIRDLAGAAPWLDGLSVRVGDLHPSYDFDTLAREPTVRGQFVRDVLASLLPKDQRRRVLVTGLRALGSRDDLEVA